MALQSLKGSILAQQSQCCFVLACQSRRGYRPEKMAQIRRDSLEERKSLSRRVYEKLGFHPPYLDRSVTFEDIYNKEKRKTVPEDHPLYQKRPAYSFSAKCRLQEGLNQTLWLTKSVLMKDKMPKSVSETVSNLSIPNMEQRVTEAVRHCRQFDTEEKVIKRERYIYTQIQYLQRLSQLLGPELSLNQSITENHYVESSWDREGDHIQVVGAPKGILVSSRHPLSAAASTEEIEATRGVEIPTFEPLAPTLDLQETHIYQPYHNFPGYFEPHPFPHAHTRVISSYMRWPIKHSVSKAVMYTFADGFSRAKQIYGKDYNSTLKTPVVTQGIDTDGVNFGFVTVQINTLDMDSKDGVRNMIWVDGENPLYEDMYPQDIKIIKKKGMKKNKRQVVELIKKRDPNLGCQNLDVSVFQKFLAFMSNK
ncbi:large ribosomal subunit protein mL37-like [Apostichopus japonicus]|uniref:large ribosomal subunit protein mL37-like n=1 Tax=Stichopus japonicus TaxID=307972 RepID=UPI003AB4ECFA